ncbi:MAG: hypothetical protein ABI416_12480 [Ginsengibacter sp.]
MKSLLLIIFSAPMLLMTGCNSGDKEKNNSPEVVVEDTVFEASPVDEDSGLHVKNKSMLWHVDDTKTLKLQKPEVPGIDTMSVKNLLQIVNANYDSIHLDYIKISHDTIYVHIPHSEMLTKRIGSTGADMYMASTTWSLTEVQHIKYVNFDFQEGDHASPGVYSRQDFKNFQ